VSSPGKAITKNGEKNKKRRTTSKKEEEHKGNNSTGPYKMELPANNIGMFS
jgi:hypothetical protein